MTDGFLQVNSMPNQLGNADVDRMAHVLRHRLRNISSGIRGAIGLISEEAGDDMSPELREYFPLIMRECTSLQDMATRLGLLLCPMDQPFENTPTSQMLQHIIDALAIVFPHVEFRTDDQSENLLVPGSFNIVIEDLVRNACEAAPRGIVGIRIEKNEKEVNWTICDSGNGIPQEERDQAFLPFYTTRPRHLGIGLPLTRKICDMLGATCSNTVETGTPNEWSIKITYPLS